MHRIGGWATGIFALLLTFPVLANNWPQFRGPQSNGVVRGDDLPVVWDSDKNIAWKVAIPGRGWSAPVVWGDNVFVTTAVLEKKLPGRPKTDKSKKGKGYTKTPPNAIYRWEVHCLDLETGNLRWKRVAKKGRPRMNVHKSNTYATETPVTDGKRVYAYFGMTGVFCYNLDGKLLWEKDLGAHPMWNGWGTGSSPVLHNDLIYFQIDNEKQSFLVALDTATGKERWRKLRDEPSGYASPIIWKHSKGTELITVGLKARSYDPKTGNLIWELDLNGGRASSAPVALGEVLYLGNEDRANSPFLRPGRGPGGRLVAIKAGAKGDITPAKGKTTSAGVLWTQEHAGPAMASPLVYKGYIYILERKNGLASCYEAKTGNPVYQRKRLSDSAFWAAPWAYGNRVFCLDDSGTTHVIEPGPALKFVANNSLDEKFWTPAAMTDEYLLLRGARHLYAIKKSDEK